MRCKCTFRKMIEVCTFKRMVLLIFIAGIISLIVIYKTSLLDVETIVEASSSRVQNVSSSTQEPPCWVLNNYQVKEECKPCSKFEMSMKIPICLLGFKELVSCGNVDQWRSCARVPWLERKYFWLFEGVTICVGMSSGLVTYMRKKQINQRTFERIQKQIASGV